MREEIGKWLLDVAKYVATAIVLTYAFKGIGPDWLTVTIGVAAVALIMGLGLWLIKQSKTE